MELPQQILNKCIWSIASHTSNDYTCAPAMPPRVRSPSAAKPPPSIVVARTSLTFVCCWIMGICSLLQNHPRHSTAIDAVSRKILTLRAKQNPNFLNNPRNCQAGSGQSEWPLAEKGTTRCVGVWIRWGFMPGFDVSICKVHSPQLNSSWYHMAPWSLHNVNLNSPILRVSFCIL